VAPSGAVVLGSRICLCAPRLTRPPPQRRFRRQRSRATSHLAQAWHRARPPTPPRPFVDVLPSNDPESRRHGLPPATMCARGLVRPWPVASCARGGRFLAVVRPPWCGSTTSRGRGSRAGTQRGANQLPVRPAGGGRRAHLVPPWAAPTRSPRAPDGSTRTAAAAARDRHPQGADTTFPLPFRASSEQWTSEREPERESHSRSS